MSTDAQIAREWAEKISVREKITFSVDDETLAAARHILATTSPPTMADIAWDDEVHAGMCAEHAGGGVVRMICLGWASDHADHILCYLRPGVFDSLPMHSLTPLPGTRLDLTPRREPEADEGPDEAPSANDGAADLPRPEDVPVGEAWEIEYGGKWFVGFRGDPGSSRPWNVARMDAPYLVWLSDEYITLIRRLAPESTPDHPAALTSEEDYQNAPNGTVATVPGNQPWAKVAGRWRRDGVECAAGDMGFVSRQVMRWGWEA